jgi:hypothetical protein
LGFKWKANDDSPVAIHDAKNILAKELTNIQELVYSIGGEMSLAEGRPEIQVKLPAAAQAKKQEVVH